MSTIVHNSPPAEKTAVVNLKIGGKIHPITIELLQDEQGRTELASTCNAAPPPIRISLPHLLEWPSSSRIECFRFINSLSCECKFLAAPKKSFDDMFSAMLELVCDSADLGKHQSSKQAALETAAILYPNGLEGACTKLVERLKVLGVKGARTESLIKEARQIAKGSEAGNSLESPPDETTPVKTVLADAPVGDDVVVPVGWELTGDGVSCGGSRDAEWFVPAPVLLTERHVDIGRETQCVTIAWRRDGKWWKRVLERKLIANARTIVEELAAYGAPVTSNNAKCLVQYLAEFEAVNINALPVGKVASQLGWQGDDGDEGFLCGKTLIGPDAGEAGDSAAVQALTFRGADAGDDQIAAGFHQQGSFKKWRQAIEKITPFPKARFALYASLAPVMLMILKARNFVVDYCGKTTTGKTTCLRVGASAWGDPDENSATGVIRTWDGTATFRERVPAVVTHLPYFLDDTKLVQNPDDVAKTVYGVVQGRGRGRGSVKGLARQAAWHTVLFSTGEQPVTSFTQDGGTRARVLSVWGAPFKKVDAATRKTVRRLNDSLKRNYGHAGPRFVEYVVSHRNDWPAWKKEYLDKVNHFEKLAGDNEFAGRMASDFAVIAVAARLAHEAINLPWQYTDPVQPLWKAFAKEAGEADRSAAALRYAMDWAYGHQAEFFGRRDDKLAPPSQGWAGRWNIPIPIPGKGSAQEPTSIGFIPSRLASILCDGGYEPEAIIRTWWDEGWIAKPKEKGRREVKTRIDKSQARVIAIRRAAIKKVDG